MLVTKKCFFVKTPDAAVTRFSVLTWFQKFRFAEAVPAPNTYRRSCRSMWGKRRWACWIKART